MGSNELDENDLKRQLLLVRKWMGEESGSFFINRLIKYIRMSSEAFRSGGGYVLTLYLRWYFDRIFCLVKKKDFFDSEEGLLLQKYIDGEVGESKSIERVWLLLGIAVVVFVGIMIFFNINGMFG